MATVVDTQATPFQLVSIAQDDAQVGTKAHQRELRTPTRYLASSAFIHGTKFYSAVLNTLRQHARAVCTELGLDLDLLARVCSYVERRDTLYQIAFAIVSIGSFWLIDIEAVQYNSDYTSLVVAAIPSMLLYCVNRMHNRSLLRSLFSSESYTSDAVKHNAKFLQTLSKPLVTSFPSPEQNVIVYHGFEPFVGAGITIGGWSFTIDCSRPTDDPLQQRTPHPFSVPELYTAIAQSLQSLRCDGLDVRDYLFVHGSDIRDDREFLPDIFDRPVQHVDHETVMHYAGTGDDRVRHYKWIRVHDWDDEMVVSYFLRLSLHGTVLFVETTRCLLTPIRQEYRKIDSELAKRPALVFKETLYKSIVMGPFYALASWMFLFAKMSAAVHEIFRPNGDLRKQVKHDPFYNYGTTSSVRQLYSSGTYDHYFQKLDGRMFDQILEKDVLDSLVRFLDEHDIDTTDIKDRQSTILNNGVIVKGGDINATSLAVGQKAWATTSSKLSTHS